MPYNAAEFWYRDREQYERFWEGSLQRGQGAELGIEEQGTIAAPGFTPVLLINAHWPTVNKCHKLFEM